MTSHGTRLRLLTSDLQDGDQRTIARHLVSLDLDGLSDETRNQREGALRRLAWWLEHARDTNLDHATEHDLRAWTEAIMRTTDGGEASNSTRRTYISHVRSFYLWRAKAGHPNPAMLLRPPKKRQTVPRPVDESSLGVAMRGLPDRPRIWYALGAFAGLRAGEVAAMRGIDLDDSEHPVMMTIRGKGGKERQVPCSPELWDILKPHVLGRGPLWRTATGGKVTGKYISGQVADALDALGLRVRHHSGRHRFGRKFYVATKDIRATQEVLGHASVSTTQIYTEGARPVISTGVCKVTGPLKGMKRRGPRRG
ncbi:tyrosine-type recombinase/integrase [Alloactinosynnema sp. L-07]|uniref:tyrosine-type recombinase/integrase n=1 Tax=Alloactinosynnema sp. L-07 TaxID=1653480 RepID=UPI0006B65CB7|nr:tyrosine-type recombinase/integrase [Alloactinosynnema sp. L-07]